jgi:hypothetical protein
LFVLFLRSGVSVTLCRANAGGEVPAIPCQRVWASSLKRFGESRCDHRCCDASSGTGDFQWQTNGLSTRAATAQRRLCRWYAPSHIGTRTALTPTTSVPGLGHLYHSHQRRDSAHPAHTHLRGDLRYLQRGWAHPAHICRVSGPRPLPCHICAGTRQLFVPGEIGGNSFMAQDPPIFLPCDKCLGTNTFLCETGASLTPTNPGKRSRTHAQHARLSGRLGSPHACNAAFNNIRFVCECACTTRAVDASRLHRNDVRGVYAKAI